MVARKKFTFVGGPCCGKTSILRRFINNEFCSASYSTVLDAYETCVQVDGKRVELTIMDTAGDDIYDSTRPMCYYDTDVIVMCFSFQDPHSLANIEEKWYPEVRNYCRNVPIILVGTMIDLRRDPDTINFLGRRNLQMVRTSEARAVAAKINAFTYVECSAKYNKGVKMLFDIGVRAALHNKQVVHKKKDNCKLQ